MPSLPATFAEDVINQSARARFHGARKLIKVHIQAIAQTTQVATREEPRWLASAAATAWLPVPEPAEAALP